MYASKNFKSKAALKKAIKDGETISITSPSLFAAPPTDGTTAIEGPWYPQPHTWYAEVTLVNGFITKVK